MACIQFAGVSTDVQNELLASASSALEYRKRHFAAAKAEPPICSALQYASGTNHLPVEGNKSVDVATVEERNGVSHQACLSPEVRHFIDTQVNQIPASQVRRERCKNRTQTKGARATQKMPTPMIR
jgi:hypothetical protein